MYIGNFGLVIVQVYWLFGIGVLSVNLIGGGNGEVLGQVWCDSGYGVGVVYLVGLLGVMFVYDQYNLSILFGGGVFSFGMVCKVVLVGSYFFGDVFKIMGGYCWGQNKNVNGSVVLCDDYFWVGVNYQVMNVVMFLFEYLYQKIKIINSVLFMQVNLWQVVFIVDYMFFKCIDLYLIMVYVCNVGLVFDQVMVDFNVIGYGLGVGKISMFGVVVGICYKF